MLDDSGFEAYEQNEYPLAYLITFRTYGTWLHGDERWSARHQPKHPGESKIISPNRPLKKRMAELVEKPFVLDRLQRKAVDQAIRDLCDQRQYPLHALDVRSNHAHIVLSAAAKPERIADALKAFATRRLRAEGLIDADTRVWARGRSRRYLWKPRHVEAAVDYVLYCQSDVPFELDGV